MTDYKVLFLDIDGTLVTPDNTVEDSTKAAIAQVQKKGIEVFLATGRPLHEIDDLAALLNIQSFIGYNGASAIFQKNDIFQEPMKETTVNQFLETAAANGHEAVVYTNEKNYFTVLDSQMIQEFIEIFHLHRNEIYSPSINTKVLGMTLINLKENDISLYKSAEGIHLSQVNVDGMRHCYDVIRNKVNKGYGVQMILKHLGISKEQTIAFGDGMNDKEMLQNTGESFAMGNGHPDLFPYAKHKTTEVTNSGIYNGLTKLQLVK